jgi:hypothetical protein
VGLIVARCEVVYTGCGSSRATKKMTDNIAFRGTAPSTTLVTFRGQERSKRRHIHRPRSPRRRGDATRIRIDTD